MLVGSSKAALRKLGICHSHPNWMVTSWLQAFGEQDTEALMKHNNRWGQGWCLTEGPASQACLLSMLALSYLVLLVH